MSRHHYININKSYKKIITISNNNYDTQIINYNSFLIIILDIFIISMIIFLEYILALLFSYSSSH